MGTVNNDVKLKTVCQANSYGNPFFLLVGSSCTLQGLSNDTTLNRTYLKGLSYEIDFENVDEF